MKQWPTEEQQALLNKEIMMKKKIILPVWHNVTYAEVFQYPPLVAYRYAVKTADGSSLFLLVYITIGHIGPTRIALNQLAPHIHKSYYAIYEGG